jgi:hypothetical protein
MASKYTGGRRKGRPNRSTIYIRELIDEAADLLTAEGRDALQQVIVAQMRKAIGIRAVRYEHGGQEVVYDVPPDTQAAKLILEHRFGRPKQAIEVVEPEDKFKYSPQLVLMPPPSWLNHNSETNEG